MDYDLQKMSKAYNLDTSSTYGGMQPSMLMSKFEETNMGDDENIFDNYARTALKDKSADKSLFADEEMRGTTRSSGFLKTRYNGHRGDAEIGAPELFEGSMGEAHRDPRGTSNAPDMTKLRSQQNDRMRYKRFDSDMADQATGGHRSAEQEMRDKQTLFKAKKGILKDFKNQLQTVTGKQTAYHDTKSHVNKYIKTKSYGEEFTDSNNKQRRSNVIVDGVLRDTRDFRADNVDQMLDVAKYSQINRRFKKQKTGHDMALTKNDNTFTDGDNSKTFKALGVLMSNVVRGKKNTMLSGDTDFMTVRQTAARKTQPFVKDLTMIIRDIVDDNKWATGDKTRTSKTAMPVQAEHLARNISYNHMLPAHQYINAEIIYKSLMQNKDLNKIKSYVLTDSSAPELRDVNTISAKQAQMRSVNGRRLKTADDADKAESLTIVNYRAMLAAKNNSRIGANSGEDFKTESDNTLDVRNNHTRNHVNNADDIEQMGKFSENRSKDRMGGLLGNKYTNRYIDRENTINDNRFNV